MNWKRLLLIPLLLPTYAAAALDIFACEPEWAALARELGGARVAVFTATSALQDPHRIEARPSLIAQLRQAELLICTGADLEAGWLPMLLRKAGNTAVQPGRAGHFLAAEHVPLKDTPVQLDRAAGDVHPYGNPHIQTDPRNIARIAAALAQRLTAIDSANAAHYADRHATFARDWGAAIARWEKRAAPLRGARVVVQHKSWTYLSDWLGLVEVVALEPKPGVPASGGYLAEVLTAVRAQPAKLVMRAAYQDPQPADWLHAQTGVPVAELPFTVGGSEDADDLYRLFDVTLARLLKAAQ